MTLLLYLTWHCESVLPFLKAFFFSTVADMLWHIIISFITKHCGEQHYICADHKPAQWLFQQFLTFTLMIQLRLSYKRPLSQQKGLLVSLFVVFKCKFTTKRHFQRQTYPIFSATETVLSPFARESKNYTWNTDTGTSVTQKHADAYNATTSHILAELHLIEFMASCLREPTWERMPPKPTKAS